MFILRDLLLPLQTHFSDTKLGKERASLFVYTLLAIIVPFTSSISSNLWRGLGVLFGVDIKKKRFYTLYGLVNTTVEKTMALHLGAYWFARNRGQIIACT